MIRIPSLHPGDAIAIVASAGKVTEGQIVPAIRWLEDRGYIIYTGRHLFGENYQFSGRDEQRASDFQDALDDPDVKAVIFARGGYGSIRIVERLNFSEFKNNPKWLVGFSDITLFHNVCAQMRISTVHGAMMRDCTNEAGKVSDGFLAMVGMLEGEKPVYRAAQHPLNRAGFSNAPLVGGNLSILYSLLGTPYDLDTNGKILFLEEVGEYLYHIDRMMISLRMAGKFNGLKGLVGGQFSHLKDNNEPFGKSVEEIIMENVIQFDFPVFFQFPAGHEEPNMPLMLGCEWEMAVGEATASLQMVQ